MENENKVNRMTLFSHSNEVLSERLEVSHCRYFMFMCACECAFVFVFAYYLEKSACMCVCERERNARIEWFWSTHCNIQPNLITKCGSAIAHVPCVCIMVHTMKELLFLLNILNVYVLFLSAMFDLDIHCFHSVAHTISLYLIYS